MGTIPTSFLAVRTLYTIVKVRCPNDKVKVGLVNNITKLSKVRVGNMTILKKLAKLKLKLTSLLIFKVTLKVNLTFSYL